MKQLLRWLLFVIKVALPIGIVALSVFTMQQMQQKASKLYFVAFVASVPYAFEIFFRSYTQWANG